MLYHYSFLQLLLNPVWFNPDIRHHINFLRTLRRKFINNPTEYNANKLDSSQELLQAKINNVKTNYETNLITTSDNSKIYIYIRGIMKTRTTMYQNSTSIYCDTQKANAFNDCFYLVFNKTFHSVSIILNHFVRLQSLRLKDGNTPREHNRWYSVSAHSLGGVEPH